MKRKYILSGIVAVCLTGALAYFHGGSRAPSGQAPLRSLTPQNVAEIKNAFNAAQGDARVVLLLSPT